MLRFVLVLIASLALSSTASALPSGSTTLQPASITASTGEKPQSKVWTHAGAWWCVLPNATGTWLKRLDGTAWTDVLKLSNATNAKADVKAVGDVAHVLLFEGVASELVSVEHVPAGNSYQPWASRPAAAPISLDSGVEIASIDIDSQGRMWLASDGSTTVTVRYSDAPYSSWSAPIPLASGVSTDDIAAITAFPNGKIGVLWSNQTTQRFGFRTHTDGADPSVWSADEMPASQSALNVGLGMADDHLNLAVASDGTLYAAVKTSYDTPGYPKVALLVRRPAGTWDNLYEVDQSGTRGIVLLNEQSGTVAVVYTASEGFNPIVYKETSTASIAFGSGVTLLATNLNDCSSTKQNITDAVVILASTASSAIGVLLRDAPSSSAAVGHWPMEEGSGTSLLDASGYDNHGSVVGGATWVPGRVGLALDLDGVDDHVLVPNSATLNITNQITLATWVRPEQVATQYLVKKAVQGSTGGYELSLSAAGKAFFRLNQVPSGDTYRVNSLTSYPVTGTTWMHLAATYDGATLRLYVNGVEEASLAGVVAIAGNALSLGIGAQSNGTVVFKGAMDDARVYARALSAAEIQALAGIQVSGPVGWWPFSEGSGAVVYDVSGLGNHGSTVNGATWAPGLFSNALDLDGTDDHAMVPDHATLDLTSGITMMTWMRPEVVATQYLMKKAIINTAGGDGYELSLSSVAPGKPFVRFNQVTNGNLYRLDATQPYPTNGTTWMHVAATYDGATMKLYINGALDSSKAAVFTIAQNNLGLGFGAQSNGASVFRGGLDEARLYGRALGAAEIAAIASLPPVGVEVTTPTSTRLSAAMPTPFRRVTTLEYRLATRGEVELAIFAVDGRRVRTLARGSIAAGVHRVAWDGRDDSDHAVGAGVYFVRLATAEGAFHRRVVRLQ